MFETYDFLLLISLVQTLDSEVGLVNQEESYCCQEWNSEREFCLDLTKW